MELKNILNIKTRQEFRIWLSENCSKEKECWIVAKRGKEKSKNNIWYLDAVEEALCFGWIDTTVKSIDGVTMQKFTPRKKNSPWSELNKERCRRLERLGLMTDAGMAVLPDMENFEIDVDILEALQADEETWKNFQEFPELYKRVRIDTIQINKKKRPALFASRLKKLLKNTKNGVMYGEWNDFGRLLE